MSNTGKKVESTRGDVIETQSGDPFDFRKRAGSTDPSPKECKLPPAPGRAPTKTSVPAKEILPRK